MGPQLPEGAYEALKLATVLLISAAREFQASVATITPLSTQEHLNDALDRAIDLASSSPHRQVAYLNTGHQKMTEARYSEADWLKASRALLSGGDLKIVQKLSPARMTPVYYIYRGTTLLGNTRSAKALYARIVNYLKCR